MISLLALLAGLSAANPSKAEAPGARAIAAAFVDDWNLHDMKKFGELFAPDAQFVNVIGMWWRGRSEIQRQHESLHATRMRNSHLVATETEVQPLRPDVAILHIRWQLTGDSGIDGVTLSMRQGVMSLVAAKTGGTWQIVSAQNTDIVPLPNVPPK